MGEPDEAPVAGEEKRRHCGFAIRRNGFETGALSLPEHRDTLLASIAAKGETGGCEKRMSQSCQSLVRKMGTR